MPFITTNLGSDVQEDKPVPEAVYDLVISDVKDDAEDKKGHPMIKVQMEIQGEPDAPAVFHNISLPHEDDEPKAAKFKALMLKRFLTVAGIPFDENGFNVEDMYGAKFQGQLTVDEYQGVYRNNLKLPPLSD